MKKILITLWVLLLPLFAYSEVVEIDNVYYNLSYNSASVTNVSNHYYIGNVVIPESITYNGKSYSVTSIGDFAFYYCGSLTSISIPNSVTSIGKSAFVNCGSLSSISKPNSVTSIGEYAFQNCKNLPSIIIPKSMTTIGVAAFEYCSGLTSIKVETGNTKYDSRENCNAIIDSESNTLITGCQNTIIPNGVDSIGNYAFSGCFGLTSIVIPASVKKIGNGVFWGCSALTSITIPNGLTSIGNDTFSNCYRLTSITIPTSVTYIGDGAFEACSGLTSITIPERVESIGPNAFEGCSGLTSVTIPKSVTSIAFGVFQNCSAMTDVYCYADNVPKTNSRAFLNSSIATATLHVPASALDAYKTTEPWSDFGNYVTFEDEYTNIQFADATVKAICVENWDTNGDGELSKTEAAAVTSLEKKFNNTKITSFDELQYFTGLTSIGESEFTWCRALTSITIPDRVETIGLMAFFFCEGLKSVTLGNGLTSIGECVFWSCSSLTSFTIPESVTSIGESTFRNCTGLTDFYCYAKNVPSTGNELFDGSPIESATLHVPSSALHAYKTTEPWSCFGTIITLDGKKQCATPTISYVNGELTFNCATEGAICQSTITDADISSYSVNKVKLSVTYHISVYATKENFADSDVATATLCWIDVEPMQEGTKEAEDNVTEVKAIPVLIQANDGVMNISGAPEGATVCVFDISGRQLGTTTATSGTAKLAIPTTDKIAIVKIGDKAVKVSLK